MPELLEIAKRIAASAGPGEEIEAYVSQHRETEVRAYEGEVESFSSAQSAGVGVRVIVGGRQGFAYVGDIGLAEEALTEARDNATFSSPDEHVGLAQPDGVEAAKLDLWRSGISTFSSDDKIALTIDLEKRVRSGDPRIRQVISTDYGDSEGESAIATSNGITGTNRQSTCYIAADVVAGDGDEVQTGVGYSVGRSPEDLDPEVACNDAIERATQLLGSKKPKSASLTVVLDRRVTATLLSILSGTLSGEDVAKGRSLFEGRLGEQVGMSSLTLIDDPTNPLAFGASSFDAEGLACRRVPLIDEGVLVGFLYDTYSGRLASTASTGSAVRAGYKSAPGVGARALSLVPGDLDQEAIIRFVGDGLLVQSISGVHSGVNGVSGDFSVGAEGLMIRNGSVAEPVREITIASTIQRMLQHIIAIGNDVEWLPSVAAGMSIAISDMAMSGE